MDPNTEEVSLEDIPAPTPEPEDDGGKPAQPPEPDDSGNDDAPEPKPEDDDESDAAWEKIAAKPEPKPEEKPKADDESEHKSGMVPSHRLREVREKAEAEAAKWRARAEELESKLPETQQVEERIRKATSEDHELRTAQDALTALELLVKDASGKDEAKRDHAVAILGQYGITTTEAYSAARSDLTMSIRERQRDIRTGIVSEVERAKAQARDAETAANNAMVAKYSATIQASKIPDVAKCAQRIANRALEISPSVRQWMLESDDSDAITAAIGGSAELFKEITGYGAGPLSAAQMGKIARRVDAVIRKQESRRSKPIEQDEDNSPAPTPVRAPVPRNSARPRNTSFTTDKGTGEIVF